MMPTAARLIAALVLAGTAWIASQIIKVYLPEGTNFGWFDYLNTGLGLLCGWIVIGGRQGRGISAAIGNGVTGAAALVFWALLLQSSYEMLRKSMRRHYDGPTEAILDVFELGFEYALHVVNPTAIGPLVIGGILAGVLAELGGRMWR
jgi:hypothetical protein